MHLPTQHLGVASWSEKQQQFIECSLDGSLCFAPFRSRVLRLLRLVGGVQLVNLFGVDRSQLFHRVLFGCVTGATVRLGSALTRVSPAVGRSILPVAVVDFNLCSHC